MPAPNSQSTVNIQTLTGAFDPGGNIPSLQLPSALLLGLGGSIYRSNVPSGVAPSGTMGANGVLAGGTSLPRTYGPSSNGPGIWQAFPAGAVFSGSPAGSYWSIMTSATAGTVFNNMLTLPGPTTPPTQLIPVVDPGPGAFTGLQTVQSFASFVLPGNALGPNGWLIQIAFWAYNNSGGTKTLTYSFGTSAFTSVPTTTTAEYWLFTTNAMGAANAQKHGLRIPALAQATVPNTGQKDTTANITVSLQGTNTSNATDTSVLESWICLMFPG